MGTTDTGIIKYRRQPYTQFVYPTAKKIISEKLLGNKSLSENAKALKFPINIVLGLAIRSLLINDSDSSLYVFYDKNQNVFEMDFENAFAIDAPPYVLRYNIRNTGSIYQCAVERTNLGHDTVANSIVGVHPEIHNYNKPSQAVKALSLIVNRLVQKEFVPAESIVIVSDVPYANSILTGEQRIGAYNLVFKHYKDVAENEICFKTAEEFKGLESDVVIYLTHEFTDIPSSTIDKRKDYVAITRARYYLYILNTKCNLFAVHTKDHCFHHKYTCSLKNPPL